VSRPESMTRSLIIWLTAATVIFWIVAVAVSSVIIREEFDEVFDSALQETNQRLMPLLVEDFFKRKASDPPRRIGLSGADSEEYLTYQLRDRDGRVLLHSHDADPATFDVPLERGFADTANHRIYTDAAVSGSLFLQVADPLDHRWEAMAESASALFIPLALLVPLSVTAIWFVVRRTLYPIEELQKEIGFRDGGNLAQIAATGLPSELTSIAASVDRLLERLRTALEAEREFAANSAHELRTPIAGALAQTQRLVLELPKGRERERAKGIERALSRLSRLTEKLLQLARADAGIGLGEKAVDLLPVVRMVMGELQGPRARKLKLDVTPGATLRQKVDVDAFGIAIRNLLENALTHGAANTPILVTVSTGVVAVMNHGPALSASQLAELTKRFKRGPTGAAGSGLGLAIAATLVARMGGTLTLNSPARGAQEGFEAIIDFREEQQAQEGAHI